MLPGKVYRLSRGERDLLWALASQELEDRRRQTPPPRPTKR